MDPWRDEKAKSIGFPERRQLTGPATDMMQIYLSVLVGIGVGVYNRPQINPHA